MLKGMATSCFRRDDWHCRCCNRMEGLHPHHVEYRSAGGEDELDNLVTLCAWCHAALHDGHLSIEVVGKNNFKFWRKL